MAIDLTDRQLDLMNVLWEQGASTVREAKEEIEDDLAYTSVLTVFQTLETNGYVEHESAEHGRAYRYVPNVSREEIGRAAVSYLLDRMFAGSTTQFLTALAEQEEIADRMADRVRELTDRLA